VIKHVGIAAAVVGAALLAGPPGAAFAADSAPAAAGVAEHAGGHVGRLHPGVLHLGARLASTSDIVAGPAGRRMGVIGHRRDVVESGNWSGYGGVAPAGQSFQGATGSWTVPAVRSTPAGYSSSWVGVDGFGNRDLIQTGTAQDTSDGYWAWFEILPQRAEIIGSGNGPAPVEPGDKMTGSVEATSTAGTWRIYLADATQGWSFHQLFSYSGPGASAEWVEEAPQVNGAQSTPDDFGTVHFSHTGVWADNQSQPYSTDLTSANAIAMVSASHVLAMPGGISVPSASGQSFRITYVHKPGVPRDLTASAEVEAAKVSWKPPSGDGGMRITNYRLREYRNGTLVRKWTIGAGTATTVKGLTAGAAYNFQVAAVNGGGWTGRDTRWSGRVRPRK
jgi:hypothetical protein